MRFVDDDEKDREKRASSFYDLPTATHTPVKTTAFSVSNTDPFRSPEEAFRPAALPVLTREGTPASVQLNAQRQDDHVNAGLGAQPATVSKVLGQSSQRLNTAMDQSLPPAPSASSLSSRDPFADPPHPGAGSALPTGFEPFTPPPLPPQFQAGRSVTFNKAPEIHNSNRHQSEASVYSQQSSAPRVSTFRPHHPSSTPSQASGRQRTSERVTSDCTFWAKR